VFVLVAFALAEHPAGRVEPFHFRCDCCRRTRRFAHRVIGLFEISKSGFILAESFRRRKHDSSDFGMSVG
jgi:hypothetical protein